MTELVMSLTPNLGLKSFWQRLAKRYRQYTIYKNTVTELNRLSDRELNDIGIHRSMIHSIAMEVHYDNHVL